MKKLSTFLVAIFSLGVVAILTTVAVKLNYTFGYKLGATVEEKELFARAFAGVEIILAILFVAIPFLWASLGIVMRGVLVSSCLLFLGMSFASGFGMFIGNKVEMSTRLQADADNANDETKKVSRLQGLIDTNIFMINQKNNFVADRLSKIDQTNNKIEQVGASNSSDFYRAMAKARNCDNYRSPKCISARSQLNKAIKVEGYKEKIIGYRFDITAAEKLVGKLEIKNESLQIRLDKARIFVSEERGHIKEDVQIATFSKLTGVTKNIVLMSLGVLVAVGLQFGSIISVFLFVEFSRIFISLFEQQESKSDVKNIPVPTQDNIDTVAADRFDNTQETQGDILKKAMAFVEISENQDGVVPMQPDPDVQTDNMVAMLDGTTAKLEDSDKNISKFIKDGTRNSAGFMTFDDFYFAYQNWCELTNQPFLTKTPFEKALPFVTGQFDHITLLNRGDVTWVSGIEIVSLQRRAVA